MFIFRATSGRSVFIVLMEKKLDMSVFFVSAWRFETLQLMRSCYTLTLIDAARCKWRGIHRVWTPSGFINHFTCFWPTFKPLRTLFSRSLWCTSRRPSAGLEGKVISGRETIQSHVAEHTAGAADCHQSAFVWFCICVGTKIRCWM